MKIAWQILEFGMGVLIVVGLAYGLIVPQIHMANQEKVLQTLQNQVDILTQKIRRDQLSKRVDFVDRSVSYVDFFRQR